jgi:hypothetical protein
MIACFGQVLPPCLARSRRPAGDVAEFVKHINRIRFFATATITCCGFGRIIKNQNRWATVGQVFERGENALGLLTFFLADALGGRAVAIKNNDIVVADWK